MGAVGLLLQIPSLGSVFNYLVVGEGLVLVFPSQPPNHSLKSGWGFEGQEKPLSYFFQIWKPKRKPNQRARGGK